MRKEIIRIDNLTFFEQAPKGLKHISFYLLQGDCVGLVGLTNSGRDLLTEVLRDGTVLHKGTVFMDGKQILSDKDYKNVTYHLSDMNYMIDSWTVAEYVSLLSEPSIAGVFQRKGLTKRVAEFMKKLQIPIDINKKIQELNEIEKRLMDIAKAIWLGVKILIIEDEFEGCSRDEIYYFKSILSRTACTQMAVIVNSHSELILDCLAEKYLILKKGEIIKKCWSSEIKSTEHLEKYLLEPNRVTLFSDESRPPATPLHEEIVYAVKGLPLKNGTYKDFVFRRGEVVNIYALNRKEKEKIFYTLSGRKIDRSIKVELEQTECSFGQTEEFVRSRIASVIQIGNVDELLPNMSVGDNLLVPSLCKISSFQYIVAERRLIKMLEKQVSNQLRDTKDVIGDMDMNDRITLCLERWYVYKPRILILLEPFSQCDIYGQALVKSYIKKFSDLGTTVIIIKSRQENMDYITDSIIRI